MNPDFGAEMWNAGLKSADNRQLSMTAPRKKASAFSAPGAHGCKFPGISMRFEMKNRLLSSANKYKYFQ